MAGDPAPSSSKEKKERENTPADVSGGETSKSTVPTTSSSRRSPPKADQFLFVPEAQTTDDIEKIPPKMICCVDHPLPMSRSGFAAVSRLEQFAFLLNVALRRLYLLLLRRGVMPLVSSAPQSTASTTASHSGDSGGSAAADDIMRMKSVHLDRKLSATARLPKRSMIIESPTGKIAQPTDVLHGQPQPPPQQQQQQRQVSGNGPPKKLTKLPPGTSSSNSTQQQPQPPSSNPLPIPSSQHHQQVQYSASPESQFAQSPNTSTILRPSFARNNTQVAIVDDFRPDDSTTELAMLDGGGRASTTFTAQRNSRRGDFEDESLTLGDIPQLLESEQAREQRRSLPRQDNQTAIADLTPLELFIVKHCAVVSLLRAPAALKDAFDLDEILELVEAKKSTFWNKIFKGNDKKNIKKKGALFSRAQVLSYSMTAS
jgi:hypothetical protein